MHHHSLISMPWSCTRTANDCTHHHHDQGPEHPTNLPLLCLHFAMHYQPTIHPPIYLDHALERPMTALIIMIKAQSNLPTFLCSAFPLPCTTIHQQTSLLALFSQSNGQMHYHFPQAFAPTSSALPLCHAPPLSLVISLSRPVHHRSFYPSALTLFPMTSNQPCSTNHLKLGSPLFPDWRLTKNAARPSSPFSNATPLIVSYPPFNLQEPNFWVTDKIFDMAEVYFGARLRTKIDRDRTYPHSLLIWG